MDVERICWSCDNTTSHVYHVDQENEWFHKFTLSPAHEAEDAAEALATVTEERDALREACKLQAALIQKAQIMFGEYLPPDGLAEAELINGLLGLFDGSEQREMGRVVAPATKGSAE